MTVGKDSSEVVDFMLRFQQLRSVINDDPSGLVKRASADEALKLVNGGAKVGHWAAQK